MRREVEHNRLRASLAAIRAGNDTGPGKAVSRMSLASRRAAVVMSLFR